MPDLSATEYPTFFQNLSQRVQAKEVSSLHVLGEDFFSLVDTFSQQLFDEIVHGIIETATDITSNYLEKRVREIVESTRETVLPTTRTTVANRPLEGADHDSSLLKSRDVASVFMAMNSTPVSPREIMVLMALPPPPPTPMTLIRAP